MVPFVIQYRQRSGVSSASAAITGRMIHSGVKSKVYHNVTLVHTVSQYDRPAITPGINQRAKARVAGRRTAAISRA